MSEQGERRDTGVDDEQQQQQQQHARQQRRSAVKTKALSYLRVSGKGQVEGHGFERQREAIARYAKASHVDVVEEFRDEGVSGTKELVDRDGLAALIDRIESNGVRLVLVERADRLARDLLVGEIILGQFRRLGVRVVEADGGNDLTAGDDDPTKKLIRQVLGAVAEFEKSVIVAKLRAARDRKRRTEGRCEGRKPYGDRPGEAQVIERIIQMRRGARGRERASFAVIAAALNEARVATRQGGPWQPSTVGKIIRDYDPRLARRA